MNIYSIEECMHDLYTGQTNVAVAAKKVELPLQELKQIFCSYVAKRPIDDDVWQADVELAWPHIT